LNDLPFDRERTIPSGRPDSNRRPPAPKAGALTKLRYAPRTQSIASGDGITTRL
jgi:hypothetical protein